jgi:hypothetical protein
MWRNLGTLAQKLVAPDPEDNDDDPDLDLDDNDNGWNEENALDELDFEDNIEKDSGHETWSNDRVHGNLREPVVLPIVTTSDASPLPIDSRVSLPQQQPTLNMDSTDAVAAVAAPSESTFGATFVAPATASVISLDPIVPEHRQQQRPPLSLEENESVVEQQQPPSTSGWDDEFDFENEGPVPPTLVAESDGWFPTPPAPGAECDNGGWDDEFDFNENVPPPNELERNENVPTAPPDNALEPPPLWEDQESPGGGLAPTWSQDDPIHNNVEEHNNVVANDFEEHNDGVVEPAINGHSLTAAVANEWEYEAERSSELDNEAGPDHANVSAPQDEPPVELHVTVPAAAHRGESLWDAEPQPQPPPQNGSRVPRNGPMESNVDTTSPPPPPIPVLGWMSAALAAPVTMESNHPTRDSMANEPEQNEWGSDDLDFEETDHSVPLTPSQPERSLFSTILQAVAPMHGAESDLNSPTIPAQEIAWLQRDHEQELQKQYKVIDAKLSAIRELESLNQQLASERAALETSLAQQRLESQQQAEQLASELLSVAAERDMLQELLQSNVESMQHLQKQIDTAGMGQSERQSKLLSEKMALEQKLEDFITEAESVKETLREVKSQNGALQQQIDDVQFESATLKADLKAVKLENAALASDLEAKSTSVVELQLKHEEIQTTLRQVSEEKIESDTRQSALVAENERLRSQLNNVADYDERNQDQYPRLALDSLRTQCDVLQKEKAIAEDRVTQLAAENSSLITQLERAQTENGTILNNAQQLSDLKLKKDFLEDDLNEMKSSMEADWKELQEEKQSMQSIFKAQQDENATLQSQLQQLQTVEKVSIYREALAEFTTSPRAY